MDGAEAGKRGQEWLEPQPRPWLRVLDGDTPPDQGPRLLRFREAHPDVEIILRGPWQAVVPLSAGEIVIVRWELKDLLDELDRRLRSADEAAASESGQLQGSQP
jgi:hypothetical protein